MVTDEVNESNSADDLAAVLLAGGTGRRLGGVDKVEFVLSGRRLLDRALDAVVDAEPVVVVGPHRTVARAVRFAQEDPPGAGPLAALAAGLGALSGFTGTIALLAADLVAVRQATVTRLRVALHVTPDAEGAVLVDESGREQWLLGVWRADALRRALAGRSVADASLRSVLGQLSVVRLAEQAGESSDVDTDADLRRWT